MKLYILLLSLATSAFAQSVLIAAPAPNATITPGSNFTVSVEKPVCSISCAASLEMLLAHADTFSLYP